MSGARMVDGMECIYCNAIEPLDFPKEHVVPKAFGRFRNSLTLDCVCDECNTFFGRELEVFLTRDSVEAARISLNPWHQHKECSSIYLCADSKGTDQKIL
jgi:hypothetical protein